PSGNPTTGANMEFPASISELNIGEVREWINKIDERLSELKDTKALISASIDDPKAKQFKLADVVENRDSIKALEGKRKDFKMALIAAGIEDDTDSENSEPSEETEPATTGDSEPTEEEVQEVEPDEAPEEPVAEDQKED